MPIYKREEDLRAAIDKIVADRIASQPKVESDSAEDVIEYIIKSISRNCEYASSNGAKFDQMKEICYGLNDLGWTTVSLRHIEPKKGPLRSNDVHRSCWPKSTYIAELTSPCEKYNLSVRGQPGYMGGQISVVLSRLKGL
jgi:hypothetical protein